MSDMAQVEALRREMRADRMIVTRFWTGFFVWALMFWLPSYKSIFNSMNVELPLATKALLGMSDIMQDWWFLLLPAGWIAWRTFEDRWLAHQSNRMLRWASYIAFGIAILVNLAVQSVWPKLISNVG